MKTEALNMNVADKTSQLEQSRATQDTAVSTAIKVMVVDDESAIRELIEMVLKQDGHNIALAENGRIGADTFESFSPDLIIADIRMPELSGVEMAHRLRLEDNNVPIIFMTGYSDYEALAEAIQLQPLGFLHKPFTPKALRVLVKRAQELKTAESKRLEYERALKTGIEDRTRELAFKTERLEAEKELLHGIVSHANFGLLALDCHRLIHLINTMAFETLQVAENKRVMAFGSTLEDIFESDILKLLQNQFEAVLESSTLVEAEYWDESAMQKLDIVTYPIIHAGTTVAVVYIIHDITDKDMLQKRLLQTAKLASIGELAAGVAHEINNPLGFVTSNCNTLKEYFDSSMKYLSELEQSWRGSSTAPPVDLAELRRKYEVDYIEEDGKSLLVETLEGLERVSKIVVDLKSFARVDKQESEKADINKLIDDALNLVRNETKYKLTIEKDLSELPAVDCYPSQLVQVFTNLFINASHATEENGTLSIATGQQGNHITIQVADTGKGIPEAILPRIFDPFFTTKEPGKGTGMGLSISYGIIEKHGGTIAVESQAGAGTTFTIKLPIQNSATDRKKLVGAANESD